jgi:hypothetical protein
MSERIPPTQTAIPIIPMPYPEKMSCRQMARKENYDFSILSAKEIKRRGMNRGRRRVGYG